ncbi:hypothetical protein [Bacillus andreraoultii]|uniref:hypothetical protein n=1 Tax=Bacillus andreraoultii TaxID=1499685 RepID=UPI000539B45D|nr:hypothetical protein [Bacillus andreraoultii]
MYTITITIIILLIFLLSWMIFHKGNNSESKTTTRSKKNKDNFTFMSCPRCKKYNYVDKSNLIKRCNSCGWTLTEPYIHTSFRLSKPTNQDFSTSIADVKVNEQVYILTEPTEIDDEGNSGIAVYNSKGQIIGWVPDQVVTNLISDLVMSKRILAKVKKLNTGSGEIEILVTNDLMKMWG